MITVCGRGVSLKDLNKIEPETPPSAGKRWKPVRHGDLVDTIKKETALRNWELAEERYALARGGADMAGALIFRNVPGLPVLDGAWFALGFMNSNARRKALKLTVGAHIFCCANGLCSGTILVNRVHDHTLSIEAQVKQAVDKYEASAGGVPNMINELRNRQLTQAEAANAVMEAGLRRMIGWAAVGRVMREYHNPTYPQHGRDTSWSLLNAFTYAARANIAPTRQMEAFDGFRKILPIS